ncbi:MAG: hypothetical protein QM535_16000 [Limnohabitans sp.]|nr:hypothetical protein [Limnohabitans sp.]
MKQISKLTKFFTIISVISILIGYSVLLYKGYFLNNEIQKQEKKLEILKTEEEKLIKTKANLESQIKKLGNSLIAINKNPDKAKSITDSTITELGVIEDKFIKSEENNVSNAKKYEEDGFKYLLEKKVELAIASFVKSENSYNSYHQVYEIARYLTKNKDVLKNKNSSQWKIVYKKIITEFSWKMPNEYKEKLIKQSN